MDIWTLSENPIQNYKILRSEKCEPKQSCAHKRILTPRVEVDRTSLQIGDLTTPENLDAHVTRK